jgi:alpha-beta hydrolase superfamily lysophospholipase
MPEIGDHAAVVGASMGGLLAVHVLADSRRGAGPGARARTGPKSQPAGSSGTRAGPVRVVR